MAKHYLYRLGWLSRYCGMQTALRFIHSEITGSQKPLKVKMSPFTNVYLRPNTTDILMAVDVLGNQEYGFKITKKPNLIVDAGANIGVSSLFFRCKFQDAKILAIEPDPHNFELLKRNLELDGNTIPIQAAVWNQKTQLALDYSEQAECAVMTKEVGDASSKEMINTITIPEIIKKYGSIDILKLDIEGAEYHLFDHRAHEWLEFVNVIMIELHDRYVPGCSRRFFNAIDSFPQEAVIGENFCMAKQGWL